MSKLTVIQLLNKIANNEEVPKKIKYNKKIYEYSQKDNRYHNVQGGLDLSSIFGDYNFNYLNDEIEIIEEKPKKIEEIEKIEIIDDSLISFDDKLQDIFIGGCNAKDIAFAIKNNEMINKINELQKAVNYLLEKESDK